MKTKTGFALLMLLCLSCTTNKPLSENDKEKIIGEIKSVLHILMKGMQEVNPDIITKAALNTQEFTFQVNGLTGNYEQYAQAVNAYFNPLSNQKGELYNEKYAVLDKSTVLYSANSRFEVNFKDGKVVSQDPWAIQVLFRKTGNEWKLASWTEYGSEKIIKAADTSKELNQMELLRQFTGTWRCDENDTSFIWEVKPYGKSFVVNAQTVSKGKTIDEEMGVFAYDFSSDKIVQSRVSVDGCSLIAPLWFTSKTTAETVFISDLQHPENSTIKALFTLVSPSEMTFTIKQHDKVLSVVNYKLTGK